MYGYVPFVYISPASQASLLVNSSFFKPTTYVDRFRVHFVRILFTKNKCSSRKFLSLVFHLEQTFTFSNNMADVWIRKCKEINNICCENLFNAPPSNKIFFWTFVCCCLFDVTVEVKAPLKNTQYFRKWNMLKTFFYCRVINHPHMQSVKQSG